MFWLVLAAQVAAANPRNWKEWFSVSDMPDSAIRQDNGLWFAGIRMTVSPNGSIQGCEVETSSGQRDIDRLSCGIAKSRARFDPARIDGQAVFGVFRRRIMWAVSSRGKMDTTDPSPADLDLTVNALPDRVKSPAIVAIAFAVDEAGRPSSCIEDGSNPSETLSHDADLVALACEQIYSDFKAVPAKARSGQPVVSVQTAVVRFSVEQPE